MSPSCSRAGASGPGVTAAFSVRSSASAAAASRAAPRPPAPRQTSAMPPRFSAGSRSAASSTPRSSRSTGAQRLESIHRRSGRRDVARPGGAERAGELGQRVRIGKAGSARLRASPRPPTRLVREPSAPESPRLHTKPRTEARRRRRRVGLNRAAISGRASSERFRRAILRGLQIRVHLVVGGVQLLAGHPRLLRVRADSMFVSIDSCQRPTRVKVCDGMCRACGADGAMSAYRFAASSARDASAGTS